MSARAPREPYSKAGTEMRKALARAVKVADDLIARDWRVLAACFALTSAYSRTKDTTSVGQIAGLCGLSFARVSESLVRLNDAGVIVWRGTRTRGASGSSYVNLVGARYDAERMLRRRMKRSLKTPAAIEGEEACSF